MARKPNYSFERRQRELAKAEKKAARLEAKARKREQRAAQGAAGESDARPAKAPRPPTRRSSVPRYGASRLLGMRP